jgi:RNA polymerase sigma-70 factor, ECF subfamily
MDFEQVMRENGPLIYTLAVRLTGSTADGQDLAQETFVKAYENFSKFREDSSAGTWLYRICVNLWKNRVRYEKRRSFWKHFSLERSGPDEDSVRELPASDPPQGASLEEADRRNAVQAALGQMEPQDRAIVVLRDMENRSYEDIAQFLDLPLGTVKSRLARSRERLRQLLEPHLKDTL